MENLRYDETGKVIPEIHFSFILNIIKLDEGIELPIKLIEDHYIDRANSEQVHFIKKALWGHLPSRRLQAAIYMYENDFFVENGQAYSTQELTESNWKYYVINNTKTEDGNQKMIDLLNCCFMVNRIRLAAQTWGSRQVGRANSIEFEDAIRNYFADIHIQPVDIAPIELNINTIETLGNIYNLYQKISSNKDFEFIKNAIQYYRMSDSFTDKERLCCIVMLVPV